MNINLKKLLKPGFLIALFAFASMPQKLEAQFALSNNKTIEVDAALSDLAVTELVAEAAKLVKNRNKVVAAAAKLVKNINNKAESKKLQNLLYEPLDRISKDILWAVAEKNGVTKSNFDKTTTANPANNDFKLGQSTFNQDEIKKLFTDSHKATSFGINIKQLDNIYKILVQSRLQILQKQPLSKVVKMINNKVAKDKKLTTAEELAVEGLTDKVVVKEIISKNPAAWMIIVDTFTLADKRPGIIAKIKKLLAALINPKIKKLLEDLKDPKINEKDYNNKYNELQQALSNRSDVVGKIADAYLQLNLTDINKQRLDLFETYMANINLWALEVEGLRGSSFFEVRFKIMQIIQHGNAENLKMLKDFFDQAKDNYKTFITKVNDIYTKYTKKT